jgi:ribosomal protein S18 acetylase RimI-like enzyme
MLESGNIKRKNLGSYREEIGYEMRFLNKGYLEDITKLQEIMAQNLQDKEIFRLTAPEEFRELLAQKRTVIGVLTEDGLIAYNMVCFPKEDGDNFGVDINLPQSELKKVAHLKAVVVHPAYRGNELQKRLANIHLKVLQELGYEHVCSTVSPKNTISIQNHLASGFVVKGLKIKYGDRLRYIMYKNIFRTFVPGPKVVAINSIDTDGQKMLIDQGFVGFKIQIQNDGWRVMYGMPVSKLF